MSGFSKLSLPDPQTIEVFFLDSRELIEQACHLLYLSLLPQDKLLAVSAANRSGLQISRPDRRYLLTDRFTADAKWLGVFCGDELMGCARLLERTASVDGTLEFEHYLPDRPANLPVMPGVELNWVTVANAYRGCQVEALLYLEAFEYVRRFRNHLVCWGVDPVSQDLFEKIGFEPWDIGPYRPAPFGKQPIVLYWADPVRLGALSRKLRSIWNRAIGLPDLVQQGRYLGIASKIAHDLASPLATLKIMSDKFSGIPEPYHTTFETALERLYGIGDELLESYRQLEAGQPLAEKREKAIRLCLFDYLVLVVQEERMLWEAFRFELHADEAVQTAHTELPPNQLQRALINVLNNAADALEPDSGKVVISLENSGGSLVISIRDNGKGMPEHVRQKLLLGEPITHGKPGGNGIGMQQVRELLQQHGGVMTIDSMPEVGTTVTLQFPAC